MPINVDGTQMKVLKVDNTNMKKGYVDSSIMVYTADESIFENGEVNPNVTLSSDWFIRTSDADGWGNLNCLDFHVQATSHNRVSKTAYIEFDCTDYETLSVDYVSVGWARYGGLNVWCGIDGTSDYTWGLNMWNPDRNVYTKTFDISGLTGNHQFRVKQEVDNQSSDTISTASMDFIIKKITAYV